jgi:hypothetical protein
MMRLNILIFIFLYYKMPTSPESSNIQYQNDLTFGLGAEIQIKKILEEKYGKLIQLDKYNPFDYENENYLIELKSRRINHNKYPTAMLNLSKIHRTSNSDKIRIVIFNYKDGIYEWIVNDNYTTGIGGRNDRGLKEYSKMAYIDVNNLTLITAV